MQLIIFWSSHFIFSSKFLVRTYLRLPVHIATLCKHEEKLTRWGLARPQVQVLGWQWRRFRGFQSKLSVTVTVFKLECFPQHPIPVFQQYGQFWNLCRWPRNLCHVHSFLCTLHRKFLPFFDTMLNLHLQTRTKILAHFKGSEYEIVFLKFHLLLA